MKNISAVVSSFLIVILAGLAAWQYYEAKSYRAEIMAVCTAYDEVYRNYADASISIGRDVRVHCSDSAKIMVERAVPVSPDRWSAAGEIVSKGGKIIPFTPKDLE